MENQEFTKFHNPLEYFKVFFRRKWLFAAPSFCGAVFGIVAAIMLPATWESSTTIMVEEEKIINPLIQNLAISTTAAQRMDSIREIILGWNSLVELTKKLRLSDTNSSQKELEEIIISLKKNINVEMQQTNIIRIAYQGKNALETKQVTDALTEILVERNKEAQKKETDVAISFIKEQLSIYKRKIKESEIAQLEEQLKGLLVDSTELHPVVRELRHKLSIAKTELESGDYQVKISEESIGVSTKETLSQEIDKLIQDHTVTALTSGADSPLDASVNMPQASSYKLLLVGKIGTPVARDIGINENIYNMLLQKLETAKITQRLETSREGTRYTVLDPPRLPLKPIKPNRPMIVLIGFLAGIACGTSLVFGREFMDQSIIDIEDGKRSLGLPVLGAIPRITTQEEIRKEKNKTTLIIAVGLISAAALIIAAAVISTLKR